MIITRSPLRITLGGGGTDLPSYYQENEGFLISAAIDKYVYVTITRPFSPGVYLKYSSIENVNTINDVQHPIIRESLRIFSKDNELPQIEITTLADIPSGTGLGSSGSFTTALLKALYTHHKQILHTSEIAELACDIEINKLGEPIGKQDQYAIGYGGLNHFIFDSEKVTRSELNLQTSETKEIIKSLNELAHFYQTF
jgi:D-glycero-alpha-D-manno-heptose-7-phosphate kinase